MMKLRNAVPFLGLLALIALFFALPESPDLFNFFKCKTCAKSPYLPLIGSGYFALLTAIAFLFPDSITKPIAKGGLIWSLLLAGSLTYLNLPGWCLACLIGHVCNILIFSIWFFTSPSNTPSIFSKERFCLMLFAPISMVALFSCLNLTFMVYGFKNREVELSNLQPGDFMPKEFKENLGNFSQGLVINFISEGCPYCQEQMPQLESIASITSSYRFINVIPVLSQEITRQYPSSEWIEDKGGRFREEFKVAGYPTLFVVDAKGKISQVIAGVPDQFKNQLITSLR